MERKAIFLLALLGLYGRVLLAQNPLSIPISSVIFSPSGQKIFQDSLSISRVNKAFKKLSQRLHSPALEMSSAPSPDTSQHFTYLAGKPIFHRKEDKAHQKSLSTISKKQKQLENFVDRLYQVQVSSREVFLETHLFFPLGEHHLNEENRAKLLDLIEMISNHQPKPQGESPSHPYCFVRVSGFADTIPFYPGQSIHSRKKHNQALSTQRAREVLHYLHPPLKKINPAVQGDFEGKGEYGECPSLPRQPMANQRLCRIQVYIGNEIDRHFQVLPHYLQNQARLAQGNKAEMAKYFWKALDKKLGLPAPAGVEELGNRKYTFPAPENK